MSHWIRSLHCSTFLKLYFLSIFFIYFLCVPLFALNLLRLGHPIGLCSCSISCYWLHCLLALSNGLQIAVISKHTHWCVVHITDACYILEYSLEVSSYMLCNYQDYLRRCKSTKPVLCNEGGCLSLIKDLSLFHFRKLCVQDREVSLIQYFWFEWLQMVLFFRRIKVF
jgi:hypothetical protein